VRSTPFESISRLENVPAIDVDFLSPFINAIARSLARIE